MNIKKKTEASGNGSSAKNNSKIEHYEILSLLGKGGMGEVYLAEDARLERKVAIKFLNKEFVGDAEKLQRFVREAKATSALNHPNILTVYEIGENEKGKFIAAEFVEGETLREMIDAGKLTFEKSLDIAIQAAEALAAAHRAGIAHRDIKPENIMIRRDGYVKVLDFGLAKLLEQNDQAGSEDATRQFARTTPGMVMGTLSYMSPEQARGVAVDERSDIWSLGVVLFEMLGGRVPFAGETMSDVLAGIIHVEPDKLSDCAPNCPPDLDEIITKTLRKKPEDRYQNIKDLADDLKNLKRRLDFERELENSVAPDKKENQTIIMPAETEAKKSEISKVSMSSKDKLVLTEFTNLTGDAVFDGTLKTALAFSLEQSPFLEIYSDAKVRETLDLMNLASDAKITPEIGREICQRRGLKAYITGNISSLGAIYVLNLEAVNAQNGEIIGRQMGQAESKEKVLDVLSDATHGLREKLGESLSSIEKFEKPLAEATTNSLEALKLYTLAGNEHNSGNFNKMIGYLEKAIEIDPDFANAYSRLSVVYSDLSQWRKAAEYASKAFQLREDLTEAEKIRNDFAYYNNVTGEVEKALEVIEEAGQKYPRQRHHLIALAHTNLVVGQFEKVIESSLKAVEIDQKSFAANANLIDAYMRLNRLEQAKKVAEKAIELGIDNIYIQYYLYQIAFLEQNEAAMSEHLKWMKDHKDEHIKFNLQTKTASFRGQWRKAQEFSRKAIDFAVEKETNGVAALYSVEQALRIIFWSSGEGFPQSKDKNLALPVKTLANRALRFERSRVILPLATLAFALIGQTEEAGKLIDEMKTDYPKDTLINGLWLPIIEAATNLQNGSGESAIETLEKAKRYEPAAEFLPQYIRGLAYLKLGESKKAAKEFRKITEHQGEAPLSALYPLAYLNLARATQSKENYERFFVIWKDADADMPALIAAKAEFAEI